jgi:uncharacterized membrane protein HdeD (DUF308 family)
MATTIPGGMRAMGATILAARWWMLVLRGAAALLFGVLTLVAPARSLWALVMLFGAYALVNGVFELALAVRGPAGEPRWNSLATESVVSIVIGVVTLLWPKITAVALLLFIAAWAIVTGVAQVVAAVRLRRQIQGEWMLALMGVLSIAFGVLLFVYPSAGALAVAVWIGVYALLFGALLVGLGLRLRAWGRTSAREPPPGAVPVTR